MAKSCLYNRLFGFENNLKGGVKTGNLIKLMYEKSNFLILVFANLIVQLGITYYIMEKTNKININIWALFIAQLILIFIIALIPMPEYIKFLLFCLFSYIFGIVLSYLKKQYSITMIDTAIHGALAVFAVMLLSGVFLLAGGINLGYQFGSVLFWALLGLIVARLVFVNGINLSYSNKILSFIGIILFTFYVLYDTNIILQRNYSGDFITASMDYYLDILNLFTSILSSSDN